MVSPSVINATIEQGVTEEVTLTYLSEMLKCYQEMAKVCKALVVVIKDPTRAGAIRKLGRDTCRLLRQAHFRIVDYHRAILFEEEELRDLEGKSIKKVRGRLSFFKRLGWQRGSPTANYEHILIAVNAGEGMVGIVSPPYAQSDVDGARKMPTGYFDQVGGIGHSKTVDVENPKNIRNLPDRER